MAWLPIARTPIQYEKTDGNPANGYYLKFYLAGTTTPQAMATDTTGSVTLAKCKLNESGYPLSNPNDESSIFIPHVNTAFSAFRYVIYASAADADANNFASAVVNLSSVSQLDNVSDYLTGTITTVNTYADISSALSSFEIGQEFSLLGHTVQGVGGGIFDVVSSGSLVSDTGTVVVSGAKAAIRRIEGGITPAMFGGQRNLADESDYINAAAAYCRTNFERCLDLTQQQPWNIKKRLNLTNVPYIKSTFFNKINVDVTGTYTNGWAVEIGDPTLPWHSGRSTKSVLSGGLCVVASSRSTARKGVYIKGAWLDFGHVRADGFNGTGIYVEDVWDSTIRRLSTELCGNVSNYALVIASVGDTTNATNFLSIQCEQSYHKGLDIRVIRCVINNIHAERLYILSASDGAPMGYLNHNIVLGNSQLDQVIFDAEHINAPDGTPITSSSMNIVLSGDQCEYSNILAAGHSVYCNYGIVTGFKNLSCLNYYQSAPSSSVVYDGGNITGICQPSTNIQFNNVNIAEFRPAFNAENTTVYGGSITTLNFASNIKGSITFENVVLTTIGDTKNEAANYKPTTFINCEIATFNGSFNSTAKVVGGRVETCSLASQSKAVFVDVDFGTFTYSGDSAFLTRGCRGPSASTWAVPLSVNFPAGTVTERVGYNAAGKIYQNTDSALTWAVIS